MRQLSTVVLQQQNPGFESWPASAWNRHVYCYYIELCACVVVSPVCCPVMVW